MVSGTESPAWTDFHNVQADNLPDAIDEIVSNQALNHRTRADKTMHLIVSFPLGEAPGKPVMDDIGDTLMRSLGMEHHQRLSAVHTNTSHIHMHLAVNKLDPISHRNIDPGFSKLKLQAAARELEYKHKLQRLQKSTAATICGAAHKALMNPDCDWHSLQGALAEQGAQLRTRGRGLIVVDRTGHRVKASTISRDFARAKLETRLGPFVDHKILPALPAAPDVQAMEAHSGLRSFSSWAREQLRPIIQTALMHPDCDWHSLQGALAEQGVQLRTRGRGLIVVDRTGRNQVKASTISRDFARAKLETRLGPFVDHRPPLAICGYQPAPTSPSRSLYSKYESIKADNMSVRARRFGKYTTHRSTLIDSLKAQYRIQRAAIWAETGLDKRRRWLLAQRLKLARVTEETRIRTELAEMRKAIKFETQTRSWMDFLIEQTEQGSVEAFRALRASKPARLAEKLTIGHPVIAGPRRPALESIKRLPAGFRASKNGDISWSTDNGEKVVLRGHQLYAVGLSTQTRQKTLAIGRLLFGHQAHELPPGKFPENQAKSPGADIERW